MTLETLYSVMLATYPELAENTFYDHIDVPDGSEIYPPIILFHEVDGVPFNADDRTYWLGVSNRIDVFTADRSTEVRQHVRALLDELDIPYSLSFNDFDSETMLYQDSFTVTLD